ncbi:uncharacterized protein [Ptychodera flava]|uniref:uncharacterized protein n=1 Tax=Ptychodera flava TaxID=63121 RepID=UPI00396A1CFB
MPGLKFATGAFFILMVLNFINLGQPQVTGAIGNCSHDEIKQRKMQCRINFFVEMKSDPFGDCGAKYADMRNCSKEVIIGCLKDTMDGGMIAIMVNVFMSGLVQALGAQDIYCQRGEIALSLITSKATDGECDSQLRNEMIPCSQEYHRLFSSNPGDSRLCRKYNETMECAITKINALCTRDEAAKLRQDLHENPVCAADRLLTGSTTPSSTKQELGPTLRISSGSGTNIPFRTPRIKPTKNTNVKSSTAKEHKKGHHPTVRYLKKNAAVTCHTGALLHLTILSAAFYV